MRFKQKAYIEPLAIIVAIAMLYIPFQQIATAQETSSVVGMVVRDDFATPVKGAIVKLYDPKTETFYSSEPSDENGLYTIKNVPVGEYHVVVVTEEGDFPCDLMVNVRPGPPTPLTLALEPSKAPIVAPIAAIGKLSWFQKPWGTAIILGSAAGIGYGVYKLFCSPCIP